MCPIVVCRFWSGECLRTFSQDELGQEWWLPALIALDQLVLTGNPAVPWRWMIAFSTLGELQTDGISCWGACGDLRRKNCLSSSNGAWHNSCWVSVSSTVAKPFAKLTSHPFFVGCGHRIRFLLVVGRRSGFLGVREGRSIFGLVWMVLSD